MSEKIVYKKVFDLGSCSYLMMHGFQIADKVERGFEFEVPESQLVDFQAKQKDYLKSEFHRFDSCLMALKKWKSND